MGFKTCIWFKKIFLYLGPKEVLYSKDFDLETVLGTNIVYIGFNSFIDGNKREINLFNSFICEDNYQIEKITGHFYIITII